MSVVANFPALGDASDFVPAVETSFPDKAYFEAAYQYLCAEYGFFEVVAVDDSTGEVFSNGSWTSPEQLLTER